eukprot:1887210-Rhodomonas_salina.3
MTSQTGRLEVHIEVKPPDAAGRLEVHPKVKLQKVVMCRMLAPERSRLLSFDFGMEGPWSASWAVPLISSFATPQPPSLLSSLAPQ